MAKPLRLRVAIVVHIAFLLLRAVVPGQFEDTFPLGDRVLCILLHLGVGLGVCQEVEVEAGVLVLAGAHQGHTHNLLVEFQASLGTLDPEHSVVQAVGAGVRRSSCDILVLTTDDFHPVSIGVLDESNVSHATVRKLLLERVPRILKSFAGHLDVVDGDGQVTESTVWFCVAVDHAVVGIALRAVVMGEFDDTVAVRPVTVALERGGAVVRKEVEGELVLGEVELLDLVETQEFIELHFHPLTYSLSHKVVSP